MASPDAQLACTEIAFALGEFDAAKRVGNEMRMREAGEKAWLAVVDATNYHLAREGVTIELGAEAHSQRRHALIRAREYGILNRYSEFRQELHGECFYAGDCGPPEYLRRKIDEAREFVVELTGCEVSPKEG